MGNKTNRITVGGETNVGGLLKDNTASSGAGVSRAAIDDAREQNRPSRTGSKSLPNRDAMRRKRAARPWQREVTRFFSWPFSIGGFTVDASWRHNGSINGVLTVDWSTIFDESRVAPGASDAEIERFVATIGQPLSLAEIAEVNRAQHNPFPATDPLHATYRPFDPSAWQMPNRPLAADYLSFLRWSNGGWCRTGDREFGFFPIDDPTNGVREMTLAYHLPEYMPGALPFAFDGGGTFYLLDMRQPAKGGNYPVVCASAGNQGWEPDQGWFVANSFEACCRGTSSVDDLREAEERPDFEPTEPVAIYLEQPLKSPKTLVIIKEQLGITGSIASLKKRAQSVPCCIGETIYLDAIYRCAKVNAVEPCLGIRLLRDPAVSLPLTWPK